MRKGYGMHFRAQIPIIKMEKVNLSLFHTISSSHTIIIPIATFLLSLSITHILHKGYLHIPSLTSNAVFMIYREDAPGS